jgi:hypothetical protein
VLSCLPAVERLNLYGLAPFGDDALASAAALLPGLRALDVRGTAVTAAGLGAALPALPRLSRLAVAPWAGMPLAALGSELAAAGGRVTSLALSACALNEPLVAVAAQLPGLEVRHGGWRGGAGRARAAPRCGPLA